MKHSGEVRKRVGVVLCLHCEMAVDYLQYSGGVRQRVGGCCIVVLRLHRKMAVDYLQVRITVAKELGPQNCPEKKETNYICILLYV